MNSRGLGLRTCALRRRGKASRAIILATASAGCSLLMFSPALAVYEVPNPAYNPPASYYNAAAGTQTTLRSNLHTIISAGVASISYGDARYALPITDQDPNNASNMLLVYNRASVTGTWDAALTWNREHLWPQSMLGVSVSNTYKGPASDLFELRPCSTPINSGRSNNAYGTISSSGSYQDTSSYFFPGDFDKGDVARSIFFMATRYYDGSGTPSINNLFVINGTTLSTYKMGDLQSLLHWNYDDPVDNFERRRNQMIYSNTVTASYSQHNRNPYIDHPEYLWAVFGDSLNDSQITVATPDATGASSRTIDLGRAMTGGSFGSTSFAVSKAGNDPTTFDVTSAGSIGTVGTSSILIGVGQTFGYGVQSRNMSVGLTASTATAGLKSGTFTFNNTDLTSSTTGKGSSDGNDTVAVVGSVLSKRVVTADTGSVSFGTVIVGANVSSGVSLSTSGDDNSRTRVNVAASSSADANGIAISGSGSSLFNSDTSTATRSVGGTLSSPGAQSGTLSLAVTTAENGGAGVAAEGTYSPISVGYSATVLAHATPSFTDGSQTTTLSVDLGIHAKGSTVAPHALAIHNLPDASGLTAGLDLDSINGTGDVSKLGTTLSSFSNLAAGGADSVQTSLGTTSTGSFNAIYTLNTSDQDLPGANSLASLSLSLHGIVAIGGDANLDNTVDVTDLGALATNWQMPGIWQQGDFTGDGFVDVSDLGMLATNWQLTAGGPSLSDALASVGLGGASVPEPASVVMALGVLLVMKRCSRTRRPLQWPVN